MAVANVCRTRPFAGGQLLEDTVRAQRRMRGCPCEVHCRWPTLARMTTLQFDNRLRQQLPGDSEQGPRRREVRAAWSTVMPTPVAAPRLLAYSTDVAQRLGLDEAEIGSAHFAEVFAGNALYPGMQPWAVNYGGHQFGHWAGQLGDGRAISPGEATTELLSHCICARTRPDDSLDAVLAVTRSAAAVAGGYCARPFANSCAAKRCITWACRPRVR